VTVADAGPVDFVTRLGSPMMSPIVGVAGFGYVQGCFICSICIYIWDRVLSILHGILLDYSLARILLGSTRYKSNESI
jgi:hypothetical protein